jgi:hypothetical protein
MTEEALVAELRRFILSYAEHDPDCPGFGATGEDAVSASACTCGLIERMDELLARVAGRDG